MLFLQGGDRKFSIFVHCRPGFLLNKATTRSPYFLNRQVNDSVQVALLSLFSTESVYVYYPLPRDLSVVFILHIDKFLHAYT